MIAEPFALAAQVGLSPSRLRRIDALMQTFIDRGVIAGGVTLLARAQREITIKDLLTHTAGLGSATVGPCATETQAVSQSIKSGDTLADIIPKMGAVPLSFQPGA